MFADAVKKMKDRKDITDKNRWQILSSVTKEITEERLGDAMDWA
ncbi:MAG: hypothetical protein ABSA18_17985 [Dehalococcoidia bacterium]